MLLACGCRKPNWTFSTSLLQWVMCCAMLRSRSVETCIRISHPLMTAKMGDKRNGVSYARGKKRHHFVETSDSDKRSFQHILLGFS
jgi:hypothetical protein